MPINPSIPLSVSPGINLPALASRTSQFQESQSRTRLLDLRGDSEEDTQDVESLLRFGESIKLIIGDGSDPERLKTAVRLAETRIADRTKAGLNTDISQQFVGDANEGKIEAIFKGLEALEEVGFKSGLRQRPSSANSDNLPASVKEFLFRQELSPEDQDKFSQQERASQVVMVGEVPHVLVGDEAFPVRTPEGLASLGLEINAAGEISKASEAGKQQAQLDFVAPKADATRIEAAITEAPEKVQRSEAAVDKATLALTDIDDSLNLLGFTTTGVLGKLLSFPPGTKRRDLDSLYVTIRSRLGIEALGEMREQSVTGSSGFGQLNEIELEGIQSSVAALDSDLSEEQQIRNLNAIRRHVIRQKALATTIANLNAGLLTEEQARRTVRREWQKIDNDLEQTQEGATDSLQDEAARLRKELGLGT